MAENYDSDYSSRNRRSDGAGDGYSSRNRRDADYSGRNRYNSDSGYRRNTEYGNDYGSSRRSSDYSYGSERYAGSSRTRENARSQRRADGRRTADRESRQYAGRQQADSRSNSQGRPRRSENPTRSARSNQQHPRRTTTRDRGIYAGNNPTSRNMRSSSVGGYSFQNDGHRRFSLPPKRTLIAIIAAVILIIIIALAARGCGGNDESQQTNSPAAATSTTIESSSDATASASASTNSAAAADSSSDVSSGMTEGENETAASAGTAETAASAASKPDASIVISAGQAGVKLGGDARKGDYSISFSTTGDIMFGREVSTFVDENGGAAALANVADALSAADVTIANLECPLTEDESEALIGKDVLWRSNPKGIDALTTAGIDIVSLANNHIMDYGGVGLQDTLNALDGAGILHAGAGMTEADAEEIVEINIDGVSIAFFSWTDIIPDNFLAYEDSPGVVTARLAMDDACKRVSEAKETHDIVIVAMHWGVEYQEYIDTALQEDPAHKLVEAGADIVWGNHPHVIEGIEFYKDSLISYSQGDFVCDHYSQETGESFILDFDVTPRGIENVTATPVYLDDTYGIPSIVTGDEAQNILGRLERISEGMNTTFTIENDIAYIAPTV